MEAKIAVINEDEFHKIFCSEDRLSIVTSIAESLKGQNKETGYWCLVSNVIPEIVPSVFENETDLSLVIPCFYINGWRFGGCYMFSKDEMDPDDAINYCKMLFQKKLDLHKKVNLN